MFGFLNAFATVLCYILIPNELNDTGSKDVEDEEDLDADEDDILDDMINSKRTIGWGRVLTNKHAVFALLTCFFGTWAIIDYVGFIASELLSAYDMPDNTVGYLFAA